MVDAGSHATKAPLRYMPTTSVYERQLPGYGRALAELPLFLVRGVDRSGRNDFSVARIWDHEAARALDA